MATKEAVTLSDTQKPRVALACETSQLQVYCM